MTLPAIAMLLAVAFAWAATLNLYGPNFVAAEFRQWGYSDILRQSVGIVELLAALLLVVSQTRMAGAAFGIAILVGVIVSLARSREWLRIEYPLALAALCAIVVVGYWPGKVPQ